LGGELRGLVGSWITRHGQRLERGEDETPEFPAGLDSRAEDCWEPLLIVADTAGGDWPRWAREAAVAMSGYRDLATNEGDALELLADIRTIFEEFGKSALWTKDIVSNLCRMEEAPWAELNLNGHQLGRHLREFDLHSTQIWDQNQNRRGYRRDDFEKVWATYLDSQMDHPE
jgi:hypothetical protein